MEVAKGLLQLILAMDPCSTADMMLLCFKVTGDFGKIKLVSSFESKSQKGILELCLKKTEENTDVMEASILVYGKGTERWWRIGNNFNMNGAIMESVT